MTGNDTGSGTGRGGQAAGGPGPVGPERHEEGDVQHQQRQDHGQEDASESGRGTRRRCVRPVTVPVPVPADIYPPNARATTCATAPASMLAITISCPASIVPITRLLIF